MPTPTNRTAVKIARGTYTNLNGSVADLSEGEICYATDENKVYVKEGGSLIGGPSLSAAQTFTGGQRGAITTLTDGANISINLADSNNFTVTLAGNRQLDNPTGTIVPGQSGSIFIVQDSSGGHTLAFDTYYDFAGGTAPQLTSTADAVDRIDYIVRSATSIHAVFTANYS